VARSTGNNNYDVRVIGTSEEMKLALARTWASAVIRKSVAIHKAEGSDMQQGRFESHSGPVPHVARNRKVQGIRKADRIRKARKRAQ
jgi:hypothetical protein